jgi:hypothetical protein
LGISEMFKGLWTYGMLLQDPILTSTSNRWQYSTTHESIFNSKHAAHQL